MTPHRGNTILLRSSQHLPIPSLSIPLKGLLELTRRPSSALSLDPWVLLLKQQIIKDTVCSAVLCEDVPGNPQKTTDAHLNFVSVENAFLTPILDFEKPTE